MENSEITVRSQSSVKEKNRKGWLLLTLGILLFFLLVVCGFLAFQNLQLKKKIETTKREVNEAIADFDFVKNFFQVYPVWDAKGQLNKIGVREKDTEDSSKRSLEAEIYLTDKAFSKTTAIKIGDLGIAAAEVSNVYSSWDAEKKLFVIEIDSPSGKDYILANEDGLVISESVVHDNNEAIGLGTIIRAQYWVTSGRFLPNKNQWGVFEITIGNAYNEEYVVQINGLTGKYVEGSRKKLK